MQTANQAQAQESAAEEDQGRGNDGEKEDPQMARALQKVAQLVEENAVVLFSQSGCCLCHVVKRLLCNLGVGPTVFELDEETDGADVEKALLRLEGKTGPPAVPTLFVGGKLLGGLDTVMSAHLSGDLVARLKEAGALWL